MVVVSIHQDNEASAHSVYIEYAPLCDDCAAECYVTYLNTELLGMGHNATIA